MDMEYIGPIQMLVVGFDRDADYQGAILDELESLSARGLIRVIDLQFVMKEEDGELLALELSELTDDEIAEYGAVINGLIGLDGSERDDDLPEVQELAGAEISYGLTPADVQEIAAGLTPGEAVAMLLFEHRWAAQLKRAIRHTGGYPIAQGFLTPEAMMMVGREVQAVMEAEIAIEVSQAVKGAAILDALATIEAADQVKAVAAAEAARALIVAGLIEEAAAQEAIDALIAADLIETAAIQEAEAVVAAVEAETADAIEAINQAVDDAAA